VIDEKCLSDKFRGCRWTSSRAPVAYAIRRIACCSVTVAPWFSGNSLLIHCNVHLTSYTVPINVTVLVLFALSAITRAQLARIV